MRLQVNLIPALAYALVMMFSNMTGISGKVENPAGKQQVVSLPVTCAVFNRHANHVFVANNGQIILSNGSGKGNLEWNIPFKPETSFVLL